MQGSCMQLCVVFWALLFCCCRCLITHQTISFSSIICLRKQMRWCCPCYLISKFWIEIIYSFNYSVACVCFLSWQAHFLEIRVSSEGIPVVYLTARVTDVSSGDLVQKANLLFFVAAFDCVIYLPSICTGLKLVTVILQSLGQQEQF